MSFWKKLFGGTREPAAPAVSRTTVPGYRSVIRQVATQIGSSQTTSVESVSTEEDTPAPLRQRVEPTHKPSGSDAVPVDPSSVAAIGIAFIGTEFQPQQVKQLTENKIDLAQFLLPYLFDAVARERPDSILSVSFHQTARQAMDHALQRFPQNSVIIQPLTITAKFPGVGETMTYEITLFVHYGGLGSDGKGLMVVIQPKDRIVPRS